MKDRLFSTMSTAFVTSLIILTMMTFSKESSSFSLASIISTGTTEVKPDTLQITSSRAVQSNGLQGRGLGVDTPVLKQLNDELAKIAENANPAVVTIFSEKEVKLVNPFAGSPFSQFFGFRSPNGQPETRRQEGMGSGVIISKDGYILTNNHVIDDADEVNVKIMDRELIKAEVVGVDPKTDIAVLRINEKNLPTMSLGNSESLRVGEIVLAIGSPLDRGLAHTVTMGIVSAKGRSNLNLAEYEDFIQTDAAINPGNSGGALVNLNGELVGINTAIASRSGGNQGIGFTIPINMARNVMESLINYGKVVRGYLGIFMQDVSPQLAQALDLSSTKGVIVGEVVENSPASRAGLKEGDVIVELEGKTIENSIEIKNRIAATRPGTSLDMVIIRDGKKKEVTTILDELPGEDTPTVTPANKSLSNELKFEYRSITPELAEQFKIDQRLRGVVITEIDARSSAYRNGLREGDAIVAVNKQVTPDVEGFEERVNEVKDRGVIMVKVVRRGISLYFAFEME